MNLFQDHWKGERMATREFYDGEPVQANSYTCTITRMTRDSGSGGECQSEGERTGGRGREKKRVSQSEGGRWTSGKSERRATYGEGGTKDNKCQNNDLPVADRSTIMDKILLARCPNSRLMSLALPKILTRCISYRHEISVIEKKLLLRKYPFHI